MRRTPFSGSAGPRGEVSWVTLLLLTIVVGGAYLGWAWAPAYVRNFQAKQIVHDFMNRAVKDRADDRLVSELCDKLQSVDTVLRRGEGGELSEEPAIDVSVGDVTWEADRAGDPPTLHVAFTYDAVVDYPFLDRQQLTTFEIDLNQDITVPVWK
jgi:hypothetical protein